MLSAQIRQGTIIPQPEVVALLHEEGYKDVSVRTLRLWRSQTRIPLLHERHDGVKGYTTKDIDIIRSIISKSSRKESRSRILTTIRLEATDFDILSFELKCLGGEPKLLIHTTTGILIQSLKEGMLDAISREVQDY